MTLAFQVLNVGMVHNFFAAPKTKNATTMLEPWNLVAWGLGHTATTVCCCVAKLGQCFKISEEEPPGTMSKMLSPKLATSTGGLIK